MFTGLVEELGSVRTRDSGRFTFASSVVVNGAAVGDSIAVNGCCLTVVEVGDDWWTADAVAETLSRTNLADLKPGDPVNFERPVRPIDRLGGHIVQGHVDAVGEVVRAAPQLQVRMPVELTRYVVAKGLDHGRRVQPHCRRRARRRVHGRDHSPHRSRDDFGYPVGR